MMKYSALLLYLATTVAFGQQVVEKNNAPIECQDKPEKKHPRPWNTCESQYGYKCYNPKCYDCINGIAGTGNCPGNLKCCLPITNTCESHGGLCIHIDDLDCLGHIFVGAEECGSAVLQCCTYTRCKEILLGECLNRWDPQNANKNCEWQNRHDLCGGPDWIDCCV